MSSRTVSDTHALKLWCLSEIKANSKLYLTFRQRRRESQGLAGRKTSRSMCVEWRTKRSADDVVDSREIGPIRHVKSFGRKAQRSVLADLKHSCQAHVDGQVVWSKAAVARRSWRTVVGEVVISIDIRAGQEIKRMATVVDHDRREFKTREQLGILPWA